MKTFAQLMFLIATVPPSLAIAGGGKQPGTLGEVAPERVKQVNDAFALFEAGKFDLESDDFGGLLPDVDTIELDRCSGPLNVFGHVEKPLVEDTIAGAKFGVGVVGDLGLVSDPTRMGAEASIGLGLQFGGISIGEHREGDDKGYMRPLEIRFDALTHPSGDSDLSVSLYVFGYQLATETLASTSAPLAYLSGFAWSLPVPVAGSWQDTFDCDGNGDCAGTYGYSYEAVAIASALFGIRVGATTGLTAAALGGVQSFAEGTVNASYHGFGVTQTERVDLLHGTFSARGRIAPHDQEWIADAEYWGTLENSLAGKIDIEIDIPDAIPLLPDVLRYTPFEITEQNYNELWTHQCVIAQPF